MYPSQPTCEHGNTLTKSAPASQAVTISVGVSAPGRTAMPSLTANSTTAALNPEALRKPAPAPTHCRAVSAFKTVPAPTSILGWYRTRWEITSMAPGTVMVISTMGIPPRATASAAKCASSAADVRMAGMMPVFSMRAHTSFLFISFSPPPAFGSGPLDQFPGACFRQAIAAAREPNIQRRQEKYAHDQIGNQPADDHDRKGAL